MSAFAGLVYFDGRTDRDGVLSRMLDRMEGRGPHGRREAKFGPAAFGHLLLHTTEESLIERLPVQQGGILLTAATRLDNRAELLRQLTSELSLPPLDPPSIVPDSQLLLAGFNQWGAAVAPRLLGDFAFGIFSHPTQCLLCARDHFGVKPFYYCHFPGQFFIFASQIRALFAHPEVPRRLNKRRLAENWLGQLPDQQITFYERIFRLPAAHTLRVSRDHFVLERYWQLDPTREVLLGSDAEYAEAFAEHFTNAVDCRLRSPFKVGFQLSGGLDSSAVACVGHDLLRKHQNLPAHTYSDIFPRTLASDERPFIDSVLRHGDFAPRFVEADQSSPLAEFDTFLQFDDEGNFNTNAYLVYALHRRMAQDGVRVCLDGFDGDTTVGHGRWRLGELARAKNWEAFDRELRAFCRRGHWDHAHTAIQYGSPFLTALLREGHLAQYLRESRAAAPHFWSGWKRILRETALKPLLPAALQRAAAHLFRHSPTADRLLFRLVNPAFARSAGLHSIRRDFEDRQPRGFLNERAFQCHLLCSGALSGGMERYDYLAGHFQMENRHPFMDRRLVEFCVAVPSDQKLSDGFTRSIMRRGLKNILPRAISERTSKGDLTDAFRQGFTQRDRAILDQWILHSNDLGEIVDLWTLRETYARLLAGALSDDEIFVLFRVLTTARWAWHSQL